MYNHVLSKTTKATKSEFPNLDRTNKYMYYYSLLIPIGV